MSAAHAEGEDSPRAGFVSLEYLKMLQEVIKRLAGNSFSIKGWSVVLVAGLFALAAKEASPWLLAVAIIPVTFFWGLDGYYLHLERTFRAIHETVAEELEKPAGDRKLTTYSMNVGELSRRCESLKYKLQDAGDWCIASTRPAVFWFHGPLLVVVVAAMIAAFARN